VDGEVSVGQDVRLDGRHFGAVAAAVTKSAWDSRRSNAKRLARTRQGAVVVVDDGQGEVIWENELRPVHTSGLHHHPSASTCADGNSVASMPANHQVVVAGVVVNGLPRGRAEGRGAGTDPAWPPR